MPTKAQIIFAQQVYSAAKEANTEIDAAFVTAQAMLETKFHPVDFENTWH